MPRPKTETTTTAPNAIEPRRANAQPAHHAAQADRADAPDDAMPEDIEEFRLALAQRIMTFLGACRDCPRPICRRTQACHQRSDDCAGAPPEPPMTEAERQAEWDKVRLEVRRALDQHFAELGIDPKDY